MGSGMTASLDDIRAGVQAFSDENARVVGMGQKAIDAGELKDRPMLIGHGKICVVVRAEHIGAAVLASLAEYEPLDADAIWREQFPEEGMP